MYGCCLTWPGLSLDSETKSWRSGVRQRPHPNVACSRSRLSGAPFLDRTNACHVWSTCGFSLLSRSCLSGPLRFGRRFRCEACLPASRSVCYDRMVALWAWSAEYARCGLSWTAKRWAVALCFTHSEAQPRPWLPVGSLIGAAHILQERARMKPKGSYELVRRHPSMLHVFSYGRPGISLPSAHCCPY